MLRVQGSSDAEAELGRCREESLGCLSKEGTSVLVGCSSYLQLVVTVNAGVLDCAGLVLANETFTYEVVFLWGAIGVCSFVLQNLLFCGAKSVEWFWLILGVSAFSFGYSQV